MLFDWHGIRGGSERLASEGASKFAVKLCGQFLHPVPFIPQPHIRRRYTRAIRISHRERGKRDRLIEKVKTGNPKA